MDSSYKENEFTSSIFDALFLISIAAFFGFVLYSVFKKK